MITQEIILRLKVRSHEELKDRLGACICMWPGVEAKQIMRKVRKIPG